MCQLNNREFTLEEVRRRGIEILAKDLGPVDAVRFLQQFDLGTEDYYEDRHAWLDGLTVDEIMRDAKKT